MNALMPKFCQQNVHSLKRTLLQCWYFVQKTFILLKIRCSHVIFSNFSWKTPCWHAHIWSKKRQFCQNYNKLWAKKVERIPLCFLFSRKNINSHAHILSKKRPFQKNHASLMLIFCQKNVHYLKNTMLSCHLFQFFMKNPCCHTHIWSKKHQFCQN